MAKEIQFVGRNISFRAGIEKVDRDKVYGFVKTVIYDDKERECHFETLLDDGHTLIPAGGFALKLLNSAQEEVARKELVAVDAEGKPMEIIPSVFDRTVDLRSDASIDDYLTMNVKAVYQLDVTDGREQLMDWLNGDSMLAFDFNYRAGVETDTAFIVPADSHVFAVIGTPAQFEFVTLDAPVVEESADEESEDDLDFGML